jgi:ABC-type amino acid transport substrate-binding protein
MRRGRLPEIRSRQGFRADGRADAAIRKGDPLLGEMNAAIKALRENGSYKAINDKYFAFDVFGS